MQGNSKLESSIYRYHSFNFSSAFTNVSVADVIAARTDITTINKVSSVPPATRGLAKTENYGQLTKVKIGRVPDRGGRPSELAPPPPEMPSWQQRTGPPQGQQGGSGQGGLHFFGGGNQSGGSRGGGSHQGGGNRGGYNQRGKCKARILAAPKMTAITILLNYRFVLDH